MRKAHPKVRDESGDPCRSLEGLGKPTRRSVRGRKAHLEVWEGLGGPPGGSGVVKRPTQRSGRPTRSSERIMKPTRRSGRSREAQQEVWEGSGVSTGGPGVFGSLSQRSCMG